jgi:cupin fold WbuC family metalloprotein
MGVKIFSSNYLDNLVTEAALSPRLRKHRNIHDNYSEPCQRVFNAIEPDSYIRPHMHGLAPRVETMIAIRGLMALVLFDDDGNIADTVHFGADAEGRNVAVGVEIPVGCWHTIIALQPHSVLLELKAGPFDPKQPKETAPWAPEEGSLEAELFFQTLRKTVQRKTVQDRS